jgi:hypothetical protein
MTRNQALLVGAAVFAGAALGGIIYHAATCRACKDSRRDAKRIAKASAERANGSAPVVRMMTEPEGA